MDTFDKIILTVGWVAGIILAVAIAKEDLVQHEQKYHPEASICPACHRAEVE